ncbi:ABC transporter permease [Streptomyces cellulosae]|uniref:ABC transporter permease n=1 Tax=Streptomyces cellulosae TaxID=1968 RepID=UPI0004C622A2|nr:FtsX-like permease family protein [Streptomyces cellulosae]
MLTLALHTLRTRRLTFAGTFLALSLGVALLTVMGLALASSLDAPHRTPERFAAAPVVVKGQDTLRVPTPSGVRVDPLAHPRPVPPRTVAALRALGPVVEDRTFPVRATGASGAPGVVPGDLVGHPWSTAAFAPYRLSAGRAPRATDEVVATGAWTAVGKGLHTDTGTVRVVGTVTGPVFENALFYPDSRAARLAPVSTQLVVDADASAVRRAVHATAVQRPTQPGPTVLTGDARRLADPDPDRDREALTALNALFGTAGGVAAFVSVFVVASTFAFAVAQRRREFGLLRTAGATPGQIRRTVVAEALLVGVLASAAGCALGGYAAPHLVARIVSDGLAPSWFGIGDHVWPYHLAFWTGLSVALTGVLAASWRAGRTAPSQALREASVDMAAPRGRLLAGTVLLLTAAVTLALALLTDPGDLLHRKTYVSRPLLLITAVALLSPLVVGPVARLLTRLPATRLPGATAMLVRENATAHVLRTASVAAPVLVTIALTGSLLGATATLNEARTAEIRQRTIADFVVAPATTGAGVDPATVRRLRAVPGAEVSVTASSEIHTLEDGVALIRSTARAADPEALAATVRLPLLAGRITDLDDDSIIVNEEWARHAVGERVTVWLGDGTRRSLRIAAVMPTGTGDNGVYLTAANVPSAAPVDRVDVTVAKDANAAPVEAELRRAASPAGARVLTREEWIRTVSPHTDPTTRLGFLLVLGLALLYTGISLANTLVMATADRRQEFAALRLAGATHGQLLRLVTAEALTTVTVGTLLGLLVATLNLLGLWAALGLQSVWIPLQLPWSALGVGTATCALLAVVSAIAPTASALRRRAVEAAGARA